MAGICRRYKPPLTPRVAIACHFSAFFGQMYQTQVLTAQRLSARPQRRAVDMRPDQRPCLFCAFPPFWAHSRAKADARDWLEKTEDWQVETGRGARSVLAGDNTFID